MMFDHGSGWGGWLLMILGMIVFWGGLAWLLMTLWSGPRRGQRPPDGPVDLLDRRYALGEIDETEWRSRRLTLASTK